MNRSLILYKRLLRAQQKVFQNDPKALNAAYKTTRERFTSLLPISDAGKLEKEINVGFQIEEILTKHIAQAIRKPGENVFQLKVRPDLVLEEQDMKGVPIQRCC